jgi:hypothetical protein
MTNDRGRSRKRYLQLVAGTLAQNLCVTREPLS